MFRETVPDDRSRDVATPGLSSSVAVLSTARSPRPAEWRPARPLCADVLKYAGPAPPRTQRKERSVYFRLCLYLSIR